MRKAPSPSVDIPASSLLLLLCLHLSAFGQTVDCYQPVLTGAEISEAKALLEAMKRDPRGPYLRIRWYCSDGTIHPPQGTPCRERGGGVQHAEFSPGGLRLAELGLQAGTILRALSFEEFLDARRNHHRLKALVVERHLVDSADGWVLRRARTYRGARQIEDEERQGQAFLERLLADPQWTRDHFLLVYSITATVPHQTPVQPIAQRVRLLATQIAQLDPAFQEVRVQIHSFPSSRDLEQARTFLRTRRPGEDSARLLQELVGLLERQYEGSLSSGFSDYGRLLPSHREELIRLQKSLDGKEWATSLGQLSRLSARLREEITSNPNGRVNLARMDLLQLLQDRGFQVGSTILAQSRRESRQQKLARLSHFFGLAWSGGLLEGREREVLESRVDEAARTTRTTAGDYRATVSELSRSLDWGRTSLQELFGGVVELYLSVEPQTASFFDAQLRGSVLLPLSTALDELARDADALLGRSHDLFGEPVSQGIRGLNPGLARGCFEIVDPADRHWQPSTNCIYLVPETASDLKPMAGILTLDAGNLLSHAQLLARNLGIPNAAISPLLLDRLKPYDGQELVLAVSPGGMVTIKEPNRLSARERAFFENQSTRPKKVALDRKNVDLTRRHPISLERLRSSDSGILVGPKAANLGQLKAVFPDKVAAGLALPFGMYRAHIARRFDSNQTLEQEIQSAFSEAASMERSGASSAAVSEFLFPKLAHFRRAIMEMEWVPEARRAVLESLRSTFGSPLRMGLFVRSDTNAEDLPHFSGAGLNLTVPNVIGEDQVLDSIKRVWASPFTQRAYLWRRELLENQSAILVSVLLMQSVDSELSGVLITEGLNGGGKDEFTIVTAQGVGGAVEGESSETILAGPDSVHLLSLAKAACRRVLDPRNGGVRRVAATPVSHLITNVRLSLLRQAVGVWRSALGPSRRSQVWDMEFGFIGNQLWLFQIRPFVGEPDNQLLEQLSQVESNGASQAEKPVLLTEAIS